MNDHIDAINRYKIIYDAEENDRNDDPYVSKEASYP